MWLGLDAIGRPIPIEPPALDALLERKDLRLFPLLILSKSSSKGSAPSWSVDATGGGVGAGGGGVLGVRVHMASSVPIQ